VKTLYVFAKSPWVRRDLEEWLPRIDEEDAVLLIQDGVLAIKGAPTGVAEQLSERSGPLYALERDLVARGIGAGAAETVDEKRVIELMMNYQRVVAL
jgi:sulfur relay protein TusB/DsrH